MLVALGPDAEDSIEDVVETVEATNGRGGLEAAITGEETLDADFSTLAGEDLKNGELKFGLPAALIVLLIVFGSVLAGVIPMLMALVSIAVALALVAIVGQAFPLSVFATNMLTGMGLALGIDYSLFVLSRYREERSHGRERLDAIGAVGATASRAVLFSGIAFTLAMVGLLLVPSTIMRSLATGAITVGLTSVATALTLLPALLGLLGDRVNAWRLPVFGRMATREESPFWSRVVRAVMRRPVVSLVLSTAALLVMATPDPGPALRRGRCEHTARPPRREAGLRGAERRVPRREHRPGRGGDRRRRRLTGGRRGDRTAALRRALKRGARVGGCLGGTEPRVDGADGADPGRRARRRRGRCRARASRGANPRGVRRGRAGGSRGRRHGRGESTNRTR